MTLNAAEIEWRENLPYSLDHGDFYYSMANGLQESSYVFLEKNDLQRRWQHLTTEDFIFSIGEVGFGAGINFLNCCELWLRTAPPECTLYYFAAESAPLKKSDLAGIHALWPVHNDSAKLLTEHYPSAIKGFHNLELFGGRIKLSLMFGDATEMLHSLGDSCDIRHSSHNKASIDAWFLDGFAPAKNPSAWSSELCNTIACLSSNTTTLTTYSAATEVSKRLNGAGFKVEHIAGFGKKREMIQAVFTNKQPVNTTVTGTNQWHLDRLIRPARSKRPTVTIIGAGITGCTSAAALAKQGYEVTMVDRHQIPGQEGSGNNQAVVYPKLSLRNDNLPRINLSALMYASRYYQHFWQQGLGQQCGVLVLPENQKNEEEFSLIGQRFKNHPRLVQLLNNTEMFEKSGVQLHATQGLYFPQLGWLPPAVICQNLLQQWDIPIISANVSRFDQEPNNHQWTLFNDQGNPIIQSDILVVANAQDCESFEQTQFLGVRKLRGQISELPITSDSAKLSTVICGAGYITPPLNELHSCGATYNQNVSTTDLRTQDHQTNIDQMIQTDQGIANILGDFDLESLTGRANFRCTTRDYLPIVGPVPDVAKMITNYSFLRQDARKNSSVMGSYLPNLYVNCGMGSRGLSYAPLTAEVLAAEINQQLSPVELELRQAMHPSRFLIRDLKKKRI